jgi:DNA-binding NarL/FixJ family response regulator
MSNNDQEITRVFIVEDHDMVRRMLGKLIDRIPELTLCGAAASAEAALAQIPVQNPQLVLVDISLPDMNGIELIRILHERWPEIQTLTLSGHDERLFAIQALRAGARGYVMKGKVEKVVEAIRLVRNGDIYISEAVRASLDEAGDLGESIG